MPVLAHAVSAYAQARSLLGPHAVLLPVKQGTKAVVMKGWQHTTLLDTMAGGYLKKIRDASAVAALLGPPSSHLIAIDFDQDEAAEDFIALNPALAETLRTRGARGCALWAIMAGPYPAKVVPLTSAVGAPLGEWRGACYSLISGEHPSGHPYSVLRQAPSIAISIESIRWPSGWSIPPILRGNTDRIQAAYGSGTVWEPSLKAHGALTESSLRKQGRLTGAIQKTASSIGYQENGSNGLDSKQQNQLLKLYERFIDDHWTAAPGKRNEFIKNAVPFMFTAMSESAVMAMVMRYFDINRQLFKDSRETHRQEAEAHLLNVAARFLLTLTQRERRIYDAMPGEKRKAAFRICRTLAKRPSVRSECGEGSFFLSYADIGARLLMDPKGACKLMQSLVTAHVVVIVRKGLLWEKGHRPQATVWRYML